MKKTSTFFAGLVTGILLSGIIAAGGAYLMLRNPPKQVIDLAGRSGAKIVSKTVNSIPRSTLAERKEEILNLLNKFVDKYSRGEILPKDIDSISRRLFGAAADRNVTEEEIDAILKQIKKTVTSKPE
mgnify:CR=1 FL=1